jgi:hypothetical protein
MSEPITRVAVQPPAESQARRAERGVVAAYIHELSQRHEGHRQTDLDADQAAQANE